MIERDDLDGLHTSWCALIGEPVPGDIPDCDCDPRDMLAAQLVSDALDGAALRLLRKAGLNLSPYGDCSPAIRIYFSDGGTYADHLGVQRPQDAVTVEAWSSNVVCSGDTIAEAADKCREELTKL